MAKAALALGFGHGQGRFLGAPLLEIPADAVAPPPFLTGEDVAALGVGPGPRMGAILDQVYRAQLNEFVCTKDDANILAQKIMKS